MNFRYSHPVEAKCEVCGFEILEGEVPHRTLDAYDPDPGDPYCPSCESDQLKFFETEKARD